MNNFGFQSIPTNPLVNVKIQPKLMKDSYKKVHIYLFDFEVLLGKGSFSKVYKGINLNTNQQVAVKVVQMASVNTPKLKELLQQQIQILMKVKHPNLIRSFQVLSSNRNTYIIMQLCSHDLSTICEYVCNSQVAKQCLNFQQKYSCLQRQSSFSNFLQSQSIQSISSTKSVELKDQITQQQQIFKENQFYSVFKQLFYAIQYLNQMGIIHRDLKLSNVFVKNGLFKIGDFGFATKIPQNQIEIKDTCCIGSPLYMSPQSYLENVYNRKSDIWSFGILIFQLIYGNPPHFSCPTHQILKSQIKKPIKWQNFTKKIPITQQLQQVLQGCLQVEYKNRFTIQDLKNTRLFRRILFQPKQSQVIIRNKSAIDQSSVDVFSYHHEQNTQMDHLGLEFQNNFKNFSTIHNQQTLRPKSIQFKSFNDRFNQNQTNRNDQNQTNRNHKSQANHNNQNQTNRNIQRQINNQKQINNRKQNNNNNQKLNNNNQRQNNNNNLKQNNKYNNNQRQNRNQLKIDNFKANKSCFQFNSQGRINKVLSDRAQCAQRDVKDNTNLKFKTQQTQGIYPNKIKKQVSLQINGYQRSPKFHQTILIPNALQSPKLCLKQRIWTLDQKVSNPFDENKYPDKSIKISNNSATFLSDKKQTQTNQLKYINSQGLQKYLKEKYMKQNNQGKLIIQETKEFLNKLHSQKSNNDKNQNILYNRPGRKHYTTNFDDRQQKNHQLNKNSSLANFNPIHKYSQSLDQKKTQIKYNQQNQPFLQSQNKSFLCQFSSLNNRKQEENQIKFIDKKMTTSSYLFSQSNSKYNELNNKYNESNTKNNELKNKYNESNNKYYESNNKNNQLNNKHNQQNNKHNQLNNKQSQLKPKPKYKQQTLKKDYLKTMDQTSPSSILAQFSSKFNQNTPSSIQKKTHWKSKTITPSNQLKNQENKIKDQKRVSNIKQEKLITAEIVYKDSIQLIHFCRLLHKLSFCTEKNDQSVVFLLYANQILTNLYDVCQNFQIKYHYQGSNHLQIRQCLKTNDKFLSNLCTISSKQCYTSKQVSNTKQVSNKIQLLETKQVSNRKQCRQEQRISFITQRNEISQLNKTQKLKLIIQNYKKKYTNRKQALLKLFQCNILFDNLTNKVDRRQSKQLRILDKQQKRRSINQPAKTYSSFARLIDTFSQLQINKNINNIPYQQLRIQNEEIAAYLNVAKFYVDSIMTCNRLRTFRQFKDLISCENNHKKNYQLNQANQANQINQINQKNQHQNNRNCENSQNNQNFNNLQDFKELFLRQQKRNNEKLNDSTKQTKSFSEWILDYFSNRNRPNNRVEADCS